MMVSTLPQIRSSLPGSLDYWGLLPAAVLYLQVSLIPDCAELY